ncbi:MAG: phosphoenolpyruvate synthase, partial [Bacteroidota bacterium]
MRNRLVFLLPCYLFFALLNAQIDLAALVEEFKNSDRGPYLDIQWFCADGTVRDPREGCDTTDYRNKQHARYRGDVQRLGRQQHLFLGQILTPTSYPAFWDEVENHSRLKQYQMGKYLADVDDGWVLRKAQYYRGALQIEDEMQWGRDFFRWLLRKDDVLKENFYVVRQAVKDIPHREDTDLTRSIRSISKQIADRFPPFMKLRAKIHNEPEGKDAATVAAFARANRKELKEKELLPLLDQLQLEIESAYVSGDIVAEVADLLNQLSETSPLRTTVGSFTQYHTYQPASPAVIDRLTAAAELMLIIRNNIEVEKPADQLTLL